MSTSKSINNSTVFLKPNSEPDIEEALSWYPDMPNQYAPIGWKDCIFEFLLLWNGDIAAPTSGIRHKKQLERYNDADAQFGFYWMVGGNSNSVCDKKYDSMPVVRKYLDGWKPAAIVQNFFHGVEVTETVFAHIPGKKELVDGDEEMYLWVNFDLKKPVEFLVPEEEITLHVEVTAHRIYNCMDTGYNSYNVFPPKPYAAALHTEGNYLMQENGKVRLLVDGNCNHEISFYQEPVKGKGLNLNSILTIKTKFENGSANIKLLIPMFPNELTDIRSEMALGYDNALIETMDFWQSEINKGMSITVPEKLVENTFRSNPWRMMVIAERNPVFKEYSINCGSLSYDCLWPTPGNMSGVWGFDYMGYHDEAEKYLEVYRSTQGLSSPPGEYFIPHPGFLSAPDRYIAIRWLNEHGAIMWGVSEHYLLTRNRHFLDKWLPTLLQACEWIYIQRRNEDHPGVKGIMPPAIATDDKVYGQFLWNDGWIYKGLTSTVKVLKEINHPDFEKWKNEAEEFKKTFNKAYKEVCAQMPVWKDEEGKETVFLPTEMTGKFAKNNRHCFYLDTGPLFLAFSGLIDVEDEIYDAMLKWFREGPHVKYWRLDGSYRQIPVLYHEMTSCEPCYNWVMDLNYQRGDRKHFIEGLYSMLAGARTTDLFSDIETRNGMFATNFTTPVTFRHFRNSLIYENEEMLELLKFVPLAWLKPGDVLELKGAPTYFGSMDIKIQCCEERKVLIDILLPERNRPDEVYLYVPPIGEDHTIVIDGEAREKNVKKVNLTGKSGSVNVEITFK